MKPQITIAQIVPGHRVASGSNGNPRFPGGTLRMQAPFFLTRGLDLRPYYSGTVNVSIAPLRYRVIRPRMTFAQVKWHPIEPAEDFSFFDVVLSRHNAPPAAGLIYYPHPDTKPEHFQQPDVLELLLPFVDGLTYGDKVHLQTNPEQILLEPTVPSLSQREPASA